MTKLGKLAAAAGLLLGSATLTTPAGAETPGAPAEAPAFSRLISLTLRSTDLDRSAAFYARFFGLRQARVIDNPRQRKYRMDFPEGGPGLLLVMDKNPAASAQAPTFGRMNLEVRDLRGLERKLTAAGLTLADGLHESKEFKVISALLRDPDGNELELIEHTH